MRKIVPKTSFLGGEAGYLLEGRSDLAQFQLGASKIENFIVLKGGGITRRPGTRYVKNTVSDKPARLIPFAVSYDSGADIYVVEISLASSTSIEFRVIRVSDNAVYTPTGSTVTVASSINLDEIQYAQSADTLFLTHKSFTPIVLKRTSSSPAFLVTGYVETPTVTVIPGAGSRPNYYSLPYRDNNVTTTTLAISTASVGTGRTLTASAALFDSGHIGTYFNVDADGDGVYEGVALVTAFTDSTHVTVQVIVAFAGTGAVTTWREGAWSTYRGFPRTVALYSQRTVFGGNTSQPDTFWLSETADFFQMSTTVGATGVSRPLTLTLDSGKLNQIRWMTGGKKLTIGTTSSEWVGTITEEGTSLKVQFDEETTHGSASVQPTRSAYTNTFVQRAGQTLRELVFNFEADSYIATDLNLFASHVSTLYGDFDGATSTKPKIIQLAFQESPFSVVWALDNYGRLYGLTRDRQQQIASWHSHVLGGEMDDINNFDPAYALPPQIISICCVPDTNGELDRLWMVVKRIINGAYQYQIEYMDDIKSMPDLRAARSAGDIWAFLDCASRSAALGSGSTSWTGYTRFASSTAYVVATDQYGNVVYNGEVTLDSSGDFTIPTKATTMVIGLHSGAELRMLPFEGGDAPQLYMRSEKSADQIAIRLHQTFGLKIGANRIARSTGWEENTQYSEIPFDSDDGPLVPTFTGIMEVNPPVGADKDGSFALVMEDPWPCTILSICSRVVSTEV
jgi:hypothetical protein